MTVSPKTVKTPRLGFSPTSVCHCLGSCFIMWLIDISCIIHQHWFSSQPHRKPHINSHIPICVLKICQSLSEKLRTYKSSGWGLGIWIWKWGMDGSKTTAESVANFPSTNFFREKNAWIEICFYQCDLKINQNLYQCMLLWSPLSHFWSPTLCYCIMLSLTFCHSMILVILSLFIH